MIWNNKYFKRISMWQRISNCVGKYLNICIAWLLLLHRAQIETFECWFTIEFLLMKKIIHWIQECFVNKETKTVIIINKVNHTNDDIAFCLSMHLKFPKDMQIEWKPKRKKKYSTRWICDKFFLLEFHFFYLLNLWSNHIFVILFQQCRLDI